MSEEWEDLNDPGIDLLTCTCGHHVEEHEPVGGGAGGCEIDGCDCIAFESDV